MRDPKEELRQLKIQTGALRLAPQLITSQNLWTITLIYEACRPSKQVYSSKAKAQLGPVEAVAEAISDSKGGWAQELLDLVSLCFSGSEKQEGIQESGHHW